MSRRLTRKRRDVDHITVDKILAFIDSFKADADNDGASPSLREIAKALGPKVSASQVSYYLEQMDERGGLGLIRYLKGKKRFIVRNHANIARRRANQAMAAAS